MDRSQAGEAFSPAAALTNANNVDARARRSARWPAWLWLVLGVTMPIHLIGSPLVPDGWPQIVVGWLPLVVAVAGIVYSARQRVTSRLLSKLVWPVTLTFVALTWLSIAAQFTILPPNSTAGLVLFGLLPALPCFYGAWRVLSE